MRIRTTEQKAQAYRSTCQRESRYFAGRPFASRPRRWSGPAPLTAETWSRDYDGGGGGGGGGVGDGSAFRGRCGGVRSGRGSGEGGLVEVLVVLVVVTVGPRRSLHESVVARQTEAAVAQERTAGVLVVVVVGVGPQSCVSRHEKPKGGHVRDSATAAERERWRLPSSSGGEVGVDGAVVVVVVVE